MHQKPYPHRGSGWPNSSAYCSSFLADCRQRDSGACVHGHRSWALCCIHEHAAQRLPRTLVALSCACATCGPYMQWKTPIRHRGMCEWDSEASHWHLAAGTHNLAAAVSGGTHNLVAAFLRGQQAPARCCFPWGTHPLVAADAYGTRKLAVAPCWWQSQA